MKLADLFVSVRVDGLSTATAGISRLGSVATGIVGGVGRAAQALAGMAASMTSMAAAGAAGAVAAMGAASSKLASQGRSVTDSFIDVQRVTGMSREGMLKFRDSMVDVAKSTRGLTVEKLSEIALEGAKLGVPIDNLEEYAVKLGKASIAMDELSAGELAASLGAVTQQFKLQTTDVDKLASAIAKMSSSTAASAGTMMDFLSRTGPLANSMGMSVDKTMGYGAALLDLKMSAEVAASGFNALLGAMGKADNVNNIMKLFRVDRGTANAMMKQPDKLMKTFLGMVSKLDAAGDGGAVQFLSEFGVTDQNSISALLSMSKAVDKIGGLQDKAKSELETGAALDQAVAVNATKFSAIWSQVTNAVTGAAVAMSDALAPSFGRMADGLAAAMNRVRSIIAQVAPHFHAFQAIGSNAMARLSDIFQGAMAEIQAVVAPIFAEIGASAQGMASQIEGAIDFVLPIFRDLVKQAAEVLGRLIQTVWNTGKAIYNGIVNWDIALRMGGVYFQMMLSAIIQILDQIPVNVTTFGEWLYANFPAMIADAFNAALTVGSNFLDNIRELFERVRDILADPMNAEIDAAKFNVFNNLTEGMKPMLTEAMELPGFTIDTSQYDAMLGDLSKRMADRTSSKFVETVTDEAATVSTGKNFGTSSLFERQLEQAGLLGTPKGNKAPGPATNAEQAKPGQRRGAGMAGAIQVESRGVQDLASFTKGIMDAALKQQDIKTQLDLQRTGNMLLQNIERNTASQPGVV